MSVIETYKELLGNESFDGVELCSKKEMLKIMKEITDGTPSERYVRELYGLSEIHFQCDEQADHDITMYELEDKLNYSCELFSCNVNRILMFEHIMLDSQKDDPDEKSVLLQGMIAWILLLMAFELKKSSEGVFKENDMIDCTYKLMRTVDHGGGLLAEIQGKCRFI